MSLLHGSSAPLLLGIDLGVFGAALALGLSVPALLWKGLRRRR